MVSLADLRARNVVPAWQEAVAVVQELIQTVKATTGSAELLPDLEHVALIPNGDVVALPGGERSDNPVQDAAVMLKLLLEGAPAPPELHAFVQKNLNPAIASSSVAEFSRALAFFERPGRRADIEGLVGRITEVDTQKRADRELELLKARAAETVAIETPLALPTPRLEPAGRRVIPLVAALVVIVGVGAGWLLTRSKPSPAPAEDSPSAAAAPASETGATAPAANPEATAAAPQPAGTASGPSAAAQPPSAAAGPAPAGGVAATQPQEPQRSVLSRAASAVSEVVGVAARAITGKREVIVRPAVEPVNTPQPPRRAARRTPRAAPATRAAAPAAPIAEPPKVEEVSAAPTPAPAPPPTPAVVDRGPAEPLPPAEVFTSANSEVLPPVIVRPVLPKEPPPDVPLDQVGTIEVVVDENGDVLNVKLISPANRFRERMLVSAAKMWKFRPAYKDGQAVRYRTRVRLTI